MYDVYGHYFAINMLIMRDELSKSFFMLAAIDAEQMMMWEDGMMRWWVTDRERQIECAVCVNPSHPNIINDNGGTHTHTSTT